MKENQTSMIGPKRKAILEDPKGWLMKSSPRMVMPMITS
jgi:hypothetical protein